MHLRPQRLCAVAIALALLAGCGVKESGDGDAAASIRDGWSHFSDTEYSMAMADFKRAEALAGGDAAILQEAKFGQGLVWHVIPKPDNDPDKARAAYDAAIGLCPTNDIGAWADLWRARIASKVSVGEYPPAEVRRAAYEEVYARHEFHPAGEEAFLCAESIKIEDDLPETARKVRDEIEAFLVSHPDSGWRQAAYGVLVYCDDILRDADATYEHLRLGNESRYINPENPNADPMLIDWKLALVAEFDIGDFDAARRHYNAFIKRYPTHQRVYLAKLELARMDRLEKEVVEEAAKAKSDGGHSAEGVQ